MDLAARAAEKENEFHMAHDAYTKARPGAARDALGARLTVLSGETAAAKQAASDANQIGDARRTAAATRDAMAQTAAEKAQADAINAQGQEAARMGAPVLDLGPGGKNALVNNPAWREGYGKEHAKMLGEQQRGERAIEKTTALRDDADERKAAREAAEAADVEKFVGLESGKYTPAFVAKHGTQFIAEKAKAEAAANKPAHEKVISVTAMMNAALTLQARHIEQAHADYGIPRSGKGSEFPPPANHPRRGEFDKFWRPTLDEDESRINDIVATLSQTMAAGGVQPTNGAAPAAPAANIDAEYERQRAARKLVEGSPEARALYNSLHGAK